MTALEGLAANLDRILTLEQQTTSARGAVHEALVNLLQSRSELSTSGAMLSAATRAAMGKRGIAQLEATKGLLDMAAETAALVRGDATKLRDEVNTALATRDEALQAAATAEATQKDVCERAKAEGAAKVLATNEVAARAERVAESAVARAEAAELRAEKAERDYTEAERARASADEALSVATHAREEADAHLGTVTAQLAREREVLAKVMAENVLFVKQLEFANAERERAEAEAAALRSQYRQQTESWFATAATEMQSKLLHDWGAADGLLTELTRCRQDKERGEREHADTLDKLRQSEREANEEVRVGAWARGHMGM